MIVGIWLLSADLEFVQPSNKDETPPWFARLQAEYPSNLIRAVVVSSANVTTIAGRFNVSGSADGIGTAATFTYLRGLALDPAGTFAVIVSRVRAFGVSCVLVGRAL